MLSTATVPLFVLAFACGGDGSPPDAGPDSADVAADGMPDSIDAGEGDAGTLWCDPRTGRFCDDGDKCTAVLVSSDPPEVRTECAGTGDRPIGATCTEINPAGLFVDECESGAVCLGGVCKEVCDTTPDSCPADQRCRTFQEIFADRTGLGLCEDGCSVVAQDCSMDGAACYINLEMGVASCGVPVPEIGAGELGGQGDVCTFPNSCEPGYGCTLLPSTTSAPTAPLTCAYFCDPTGTGGQACDDAGGPGASFTCVQINQFYSNAEVPDGFGFCVDCTVFAIVPVCGEG